ncbi:MAG: amino acid ABC transporter permease [Alphaproteobacteria bacterium]|nr:amino acid ABC transporter permease [Alphaproteobacteria bacterium]
MGERRKEVLWRLALLAILGFVAWSLRDLRWSVVWEASPFLLRALGVSWLLTIVSVAVGMVAGTVLAAARLYGPPGIRHLAVGYIELIRAVPQIMVIFWVFFSAPKLIGMKLSAWPAGIVALSMIASAYLAEVIRAGLASVPRIQHETAWSSGLGATQTFVHVALPQALRNMLPALIAHFVMMFKITSLVYVIGLIDFFRAIVLVNNREFAPYELYLTMGAVYFVCSWALSLLVRRLDPKYTLQT